MTNIDFIHDIPLIEDVFKYDIILLGTGIHNSLGNGFQYDVKINFPKVQDAVKKTPYADSRKLGTVTVINNTPIFCVGFIHKGAYRNDINPDFLDYNALENVIKLVDDNFEKKTIACPLIGCSKYDGNGNKEKVLEIFNTLSDKNKWTIYDYEQRDYREVNNEKWAKIIEQMGKISYKEMRKLKDEFIKIRKYGIHNYKNF